MRPAIMNRRLLFVLLTLPMVIFACNLPSTEPSPPPAVKTKLPGTTAAKQTKPDKSHCRLMLPWPRLLQLAHYGLGPL